MTSKAVRQPDERAKAIEAVQLRRSGLPYREISEQLGYWADESGARHAVARLLDRREAESVDELRAVEGERLDALQAAHWQAALRGDIDATKVVLQVIDRRAKLFGLNAPTRLAVGPGMSDREFAEQMAELIAVISPETLGEALRSLPGGVGRALPDAGGLSAMHEGDGTGDATAFVRAAHGRDSGPVDDSEPWSNL